MRVLLTHAVPSIEQAALRLGRDHVGRLITPRHLTNLPGMVASGLPWAADNDGFGGVHVERFEAMVEAITDLPAGLFLVVPDMLADARGTRRSFDEWAPRLEHVGTPLAFVLQDGVTPAAVPWDEIGAVFLGGSTEAKLGSAFATLAHEAHERGKWVHMGRVNSLRRLRYAQSIGCDSIDGSGWVRFERAMGHKLQALPFEQQVLTHFLRSDR